MGSAEGESGVTALSETPEVSAVKGAHGGDDLNVLVLRCDVCVYSVCARARKLNGRGCTYVCMLWNLDSQIFVFFFVIVFVRLSISLAVLINPAVDTCWHPAVDMCLHMLCINLVTRTGVHSLIAGGRLPMPSNIPLLENLSSTPPEVSVTLSFVFIFKSSSRCLSLFSPLSLFLPLLPHDVCSCTDGKKLH